MRYVAFIVTLLLLYGSTALAFAPKSIKGGLPFGHARQFLINNDWRYLEDPTENIADLPRSEEQWVSVTIPHTWNAFDAVDMIPGYRRSASWYEKEIIVPASVGGSRIILHFEGVNIKSRVYVNKKYAGGHIGGYLGFDVDITPFVKKGAKNIIDVRADNSFDREVIPSQTSDFFIYGGLCRNVWMKVVPPQHIQALNVRTTEVSNQSAGTSIEVKLANNSAQPIPVVIEGLLKDKDQKIVSKHEMKASILPGIQSITLNFPAMTKPSLWSPTTPTLYTAAVVLKQGGKIIDTSSDRYGYRWFEFKDHGPFYLNGERLLLRGTQRHEEYAGLGNAVPDSLQRKDITMAKEMGANFIRLAHYPQAPEVYRACDELGILVWDELPWCRGGVGDKLWKENTRRMLGEMIDQNFNHPSIIIWSLGNELYWLPDFPGGDDIDSLRRFFVELNDIAHRRDPSRVTAARKFIGGEDLPDVFSPSIWSGWYSGSYFQYEKALTDAKVKYKHFLHMEYGGDTHVGRHSENPVDGEGYFLASERDTSGAKIKMKNVSLQSDWNENYMVNLIDWHLHVAESLDWFTGNAQWILKDFATPLRAENPIPYVNQKGVLDRAGVPKDIFYVYKSYWTADPKFCYIESHTWTHRSGPKNVKRGVKVYSNCSEVELLLNGVSEGKRRRDIKKYPACGLSWEVNFTEGRNILQAIGYENGVKISDDSTVVSYTFKKNGEADHIEFFTESLPNGNLLVNALAVDKNNVRCIDYNKRVYFASTGSGKLLGDFGTPTRSLAIEMANGKARIEFQPAASGSATIEVRNYDFKGSFLTLGNKLP